MKKILLIILGCMLITGCFGYQELNSMAIITTIGITKNKDTYEIILKETIPRKEENKTENTYKYYRAKAKSLDSAFSKVKQNSSKELYLKQIQNIIVTKKTIVKKLPKFLKNRIVLFQTKNLEKVLKTNSNYQYLNNLAKEDTVTLGEIRKKKKKKIPSLKVYQNELLIEV